MCTTPDISCGVHHAADVAFCHHPAPGTRQPEPPPPPQRRGGLVLAAALSRLAAVVVLAGCGGAETEAQPANSATSTASAPAAPTTSAAVESASPEELVVEYAGAIQALDLERFLALTSSSDKDKASERPRYNLEQIMRALQASVSQIEVTGTREYGGGSIDGLPAYTVDVTLLYEGAQYDDLLVVVEEPGRELRVLLDYSFPGTAAA